MIKVSTIKKNPNNPRQIRDEKFDKLKRSIESFPEMMALRPMIVDSDNVLLGGNMRLAAIKALGMKEVPPEWVKRADTLTDEQKAEFIIKDNVGFGDWEWDALANEWDENLLTEWGLDIPGFEAVEPVEEDEAAASEAINKAVELQQKWQTASGQLWKLGEHRLICGDCTDKDVVDRLMQNQIASLAPVDPPYNVGFVYDGETVDDSKTREEYQSFSAAWFLVCQSVSERQIVTPGCYNLASWCRWFEPKHIAAWTKTNSMTNGVVSRFWCWEPLLFFGDKWPRKRPNDVFDFPIGQQAETANHPCPKPLKMWGDLIENYSESGDLIYEAFLGSGTTLIACEEKERICFGMEISPEYMAINLERWSNLTGKTPELVDA